MRFRYFYTVLSLMALIFSMPVDCFSQDGGAVRAFDEGTRLLNSGDFTGAVGAFDRAESLGYGSSALFHNRGIAHYRLDELGRAIQYLEKARFLSKSDATIHHSLDIVSSRMIDSYSQLPVPVWTRFQRTILNVVPIAVLMYLGLGFYLVTCAALLCGYPGILEIGVAPAHAGHFCGSGLRSHSHVVNFIYLACLSTGGRNSRQRNLAHGTARYRCYRGRERPRRTCCWHCFGWPGLVACPASEWGSRMGKI